MLTMLLAAAAALTATAPRHVIAVPRPPVIEVNCDAGQKLDAAFKSVAGVAGATIRIHGTCVGNFVVTASDSLHIEGTSPDQSILEAPPDGAARPVLEVRDSRYVTVAHVALRKGDGGIWFYRSHESTVTACEIDHVGGGVGYFNSDRSAIVDCTIHDTDVGVDVYDRSWVSVLNTRITNSSRVGVGALYYSSVGLVDTEISGGRGAGVDLGIFCEGVLWNCSLHDNGGVHLNAWNGSRVLMRGGRAGVPGDMTSEAMAIWNSSTFEGWSELDVYGNVRVMDNSYFDLSDSTLHGNMIVARFAKAVLGLVQADQPIQCETGGDVACQYNTRVPTFGCATASACAPQGAAAESAGASPDASAERRLREDRERRLRRLVPEGR